MERRIQDDQDTVDAPPFERLIELVVHVTECDPNLAMQVVEKVAPAELPDSVDGKLELLARAMCRLRRELDLREGPPRGGAGRDAVDLREPAAKP